MNLAYTDKMSMAASTEVRVPLAPALLGQAASRLVAAGEDAHLRELARDALRTLFDDTTCGEDAWGYPWDTQTRWSHYPGGSPNVVATAFSANALAEAAVTFDEPAWRARAERAARWVACELFLPEEGYFAYHGHSDRLVHNANLLGAALVHELAHDAPGASEAVRIATARTLDAQRDDGTWPYGEAAGLEWVDGFHTGYVLDSLCRLEGVDPRIPSAIERGARVYMSDFFDSEGRARLWRGKRYPEDSHSAGTGMTVLTRLAQRDLRADRDRKSRSSVHVDGHDASELPRHLPSAALGNHACVLHTVVRRARGAWPCVGRGAIGRKLSASWPSRQSFLSGSCCVQSCVGSAGA